MKTCSTCNCVKPLGEFYRDPRTKDGRRSSCKPCIRERQRIYSSAPENAARARAAAREWAEANPERAKVLARRTYERTREARIAVARAWRENNPERYRELVAARRARDPERCAAHSQRYRDRKLGAFVCEVTRQEIYDRDGGCCKLCGEAVDPFDFHLDHIVPVSRGGEHSPENIQLAHPRCNQIKGARLSEDLRALHVYEIASELLV